MGKSVVCRMGAIIARFLLYILLTFHLGVFSFSHFWVVLPGSSRWALRKPEPQHRSSQTQAVELLECLPPGMVEALPKGACIPRGG